MADINYLHEEHIHNTKSAEEVLPYVFSLVQPASVIDVGCGTGTWLAVAKKLGSSKVIGLDGINSGIGKLVIKLDEFKAHDLSLPLELHEKFDLAICLEVAEHLPETASDNLINILTGHTDLILFSAAIPGQGGQFHLNEQWPEYWQKKFSVRGYKPFDILRNKFWYNEDVDWWYKQNMFIYAKPEAVEILNASFVDTNLISYVHPQLFQIQVKNEQRLKQLIKDRIWNPPFWPTFKLLVKSIFKRQKSEEKLNE